MTEAPSVQENLLEIRSVRKSFPGVLALRGVSFEVRRGEVHALVGENGAGKSTLMKILCGVYSQYEGEIRLDGQPLTLQSPRDAQNAGIAIVHQELNLVQELTVAENIFLGREPRTALGLLDKKRMQKEARALLARLQTDLSPDRLVNSLRVGEQQLVEAAKALAPGARLLILDEPTPALSTAETPHLFTVIAALKREGVTIIYISHKFEEIFHLADRITVLRDGEHVSTLVSRDINTNELIRLMVGRNITDLFPKKISAAVTAPPDEALRVENFGLIPKGTGNDRRALQNISFRLQSGEILGVAVRAHRTAGSRVRRSRLAFPARARFHSEDRAAVPVAARGDSGGDRVCDRGPQRAEPDPWPAGTTKHHACGARRFLRAGFLRIPEETRVVQESVRSLRIKTPGIGTLVETLSGGNQQKVALAKCLLLKPDVLLLDEPTRGIDIGAKAEIYALIRGLAAEGTAILLASSELPEILGLCD